MSFEKRAVTRGTFYIAVQGVVQYFFFLTYVVLARILSPSEIGEIILLNGAYVIFSTVSLFSLGTATTRYVAQFDGAGGAAKVTGVTWTAMRLAVALSVPSFLAVALISPQLTRLIFGNELGSGVLVLVVLAAVIANFATILAALLWGLNLFGQMATVNVVSVVSGRAIGIILAASQLRLEGFFIGWIIGNTLTLLIAVGYARPHLTEGSNHALALPMLRYSYPILVSSLVVLVQQWADVTILYGLTRNVVYTGMYYLGLNGANVLSTIGIAIASAVFPSLSSLHSRADTHSFRRTLRVAERALNTLVIPASLGLAAIAPLAVSIAYGRTYLGATIPFALLTLSSIFTAYQVLMATVLQSVARTQPLIKISAVAALTEVILSGVLVPPLNVIGSAVARFCMVLASLLLTYWYVKGETWPSLDKQQLTKCVALSVIVGTVLFGFDSYLLSRLAFSPLGRLLLDAGVFVLVYVAGLVILKPLHLEDIDLLKSAVPPLLQGPLRMLEHRIVQS